MGKDNNFIYISIAVIAALFVFSGGLNRFSGFFASPSYRLDKIVTTPQPYGSNGGEGLQYSGYVEPQSPEFASPCGTVRSLADSAFEGDTTSLYSAVTGFMLGYNLEGSYPQQAGGKIRRAGPDNFLGTTDDGPNAFFGSNIDWVNNYPYGTQFHISADPTDSNAEEVAAYAKRLGDTSMAIIVAHGGENKRLDGDGYGDDVFTMVRTFSLLASPPSFDIATGSAGPRLAWALNNVLYVVEGGLDGRIGPEDPIRPIPMPQNIQLSKIMQVAENCKIMGVGGGQVTLVDLGQDCSSKPRIVTFPNGPTMYSYDIHAKMTEDGGVIVYGKSTSNSPPYQNVELVAIQASVGTPRTFATIPSSEVLRSIDVFKAAGLTTAVYLTSTGLNNGKQHVVFAGPDDMLGTADDSFIETAIADTLLGTPRRSTYVSGASAFVHGQHRAIISHANIDMKAINLGC